MPSIFNRAGTALIGAATLILCGGSAEAIQYTFENVTGSYTAGATGNRGPRNFTVSFTGSFDYTTSGGVSNVAASAFITGDSPNPSSFTFTSGSFDSTFNELSLSGTGIANFVLSDDLIEAPNTSLPINAINLANVCIFYNGNNGTCRTFGQANLSNINGNVVSEFPASPPRPSP